MPKQTKKPKYPKEIWVEREYVGTTADENMLVVHETVETMEEGEIAIYKFVRLAKVTRTVKVE